MPTSTPTPSPTTTTEPNKKKDEQEHVMSEEEKLDETLKESFPASDPPGH